MDNITVVIEDMMRFAVLLRQVGLSELASGYEGLAAGLRGDPSEQRLHEARAWVRSTYEYKGSGSIFDRYVAGEEFGSVNQALTDEYHVLAKKLGNFASQE